MPIPRILVLNVDSSMSKDEDALLTAKEVSAQIKKDKRLQKYFKLVIIHEPSESDKELNIKLTSSLSKSTDLFVVHDGIENQDELRNYVLNGAKVMSVGPKTKTVTDELCLESHEVFSGQIFIHRAMNGCHKISDDEEKSLRLQIMKNPKLRQHSETVDAVFQK